MLIVDDILLSPVNGILWIFREIHKAAKEELGNEAESITDQLRNLYMQLETSRISEQQFDDQEKILLDRLDRLEADPESSGHGDPESSGHGDPESSDNGDPESSDNGDPESSDNGDPESSGEGDPESSGEGDPESSGDGESEETLVGGHTESHVERHVRDT